MKAINLLFIIVVLFQVSVTKAQESYLSVHYDRPTHKISPLLWGIFFEEINHAGDGGLYAELIKNRGFSQKHLTLDGYSAVKNGSADCTIHLSNASPLNNVMKNSLRLSVNTNVASGERVGVANSGFWGIPIRPDYTEYRASFYARSTSYTGPLRVSIESIDGSVVFATAAVASISQNFAKYEVLLTPTNNAIPRNDTVFTITANGPLSANTSIFFNVISLFPPTWKNRPNGMRIDLAQKLADMKPTFFRFPGGNFLEGDIVDQRYIWEETLGDNSQRPGHRGCWGYYSSDGLGLLEYLQFAEDLNVEIILGVYAGYSLSGETVPYDRMGPHIQSALNEIEYVIGNTSTTWGARRAADGHPEPFNLTYVEVGNEDWFSSDYEIRYPFFYDAIIAKYPQLVIIATQDVRSRPVPVLDDHFYRGFGWFPDNHRFYDNHPRNGSKIFVGEYATRDDYNPRPEANAAAAMDDAAFMTGMERNSDIVIMACYAPLFGHVDDLIWTPDGIYYDGLQSFATPAWWVQHLFGTKTGDTYIPTESNANPQKIFHVATIKTDENILILKIVNTNVADIMIHNIQIEGVDSTSGGTLTVLTGGRWEVNDLENPLRIAPITNAFNVISNNFSYNAPAFSLSVFEIQM